MVGHSLMGPVQTYQAQSPRVTRLNFSAFIFYIHWDDITESEFLSVAWAELGVPRSSFHPAAIPSTAGSLSPPACGWPRILYVNAVPITAAGGHQLWTDNLSPSSNNGGDDRKFGNFDF